MVPPQRASWETFRVGEAFAELDDRVEVERREEEGVVEARVDSVDEDALGVRDGLADEDVPEGCDELEIEDVLEDCNKLAAEDALED